MQCKIKVLLFARAFLASDMALKLSEIDRIDLYCAVTNNAEYLKVIKFLPKDRVIKIVDDKNDIYISKLVDDRLIQFLNKCRFFRLERREIGLNISRNWYKQFNKFIIQNSIDAIIDEPLSTTINYCLQIAANDAGIKVFHFHSCWIPGYSFFSFNEHQDALAIYRPKRNIQAYYDLVKAHSANRQKGFSPPLYIEGINRLTYKLKNTLNLILGYISRLCFKKEVFTENFKEFISYDLKCVLNSVLEKNRYSTKLKGECSNILFPLHYYPEAVLQTWSVYTRQHELAELLVDNLPKNAKLIIKEHPQQVGATGLAEYYNLVNNKNVVIIKGSVPALTLAKDIACVVSIGSTLVMDYASNNIPCAVFGKPHFRNAPGVTHFPLINDDFKLWLNEKCNAFNKNKSVSNENIIIWYADFLSQHCIKASIMPNKVEIDEDEFMNLMNDNI